MKTYSKPLPATVSTDNRLEIKDYPFSKFDPFSDLLHKTSLASKFEDPFQREVNDFHKEKTIQVSNAFEDLMPGNNKGEQEAVYSTKDYFFIQNQFEPQVVYDTRKKNPSIEKRDPLPGYSSLYHMFGYSKDKDPALYANLRESKFL